MRFLFLSWTGCLCSWFLCFGSGGVSWGLRAQEGHVLGGIGGRPHSGDGGIVDACSCLVDIVKANYISTRNLLL